MYTLLIVFCFSLNNHFLIALCRTCWVIIVVINNKNYQLKIRSCQFFRLERIYNRANSGQNLLIQRFILIRESFHFSKKFKKESAEEEYLNQTSDVDSSECLSNYSEDREADLSDSLTSMSSGSNGCYGSNEKVSLVYFFPK